MSLLLRSLAVFLLFSLALLTEPPVASGATPHTAQDSLPTADFGLDVVFGCGPFLVQLINYSSSNATEFQWWIEGVTTFDSSASNPIVQLQQAGDYNIQLIASNDCGADTIIRSVEVNGLPEANFSYDNELGQLELRTDNLSVNAYAFQWDLGDGSSSTQTNPIHTYSTDGAYTIRLIAFNDCGQDTFQQTVDIVTPPQAGFYFPEDTVCSPFAATPIDTSSSNVSTSHWSAPGGIVVYSAQEQPVFIYSTPGTYTLTLTVVNAADTSSVSQNLTVLGQPQASFVINYSLGDTVVVLSNTSQMADSYTWQFGDGQESNAFAPTHAYSDEGTYTVQLAVANACGADTAASSVDILKPPEAGFELSTSQGCAPFTPVVSNTASSNTDHWFWTAEGASPAAATGPSPSFTYTTPGVYQIIQTVSNELGSRSDTLVVTVKGPPAAAFDYMADGASVAFQAQYSNADDWDWSFGDGNSGTGAQITHVYDSPGVFEVSLAAENECGLDSKSRFVKVEGNAPQARIIRSDSLGCVPLTVNFSANNTGDSIHQWQWVFPGGVPAQATEPSPVVKYYDAGVYPVRLLVTNPFGTGVDSLLTAVQVRAQPETSFTVLMNGLQADFHDQSTGGGLSYLWDFGDGGSATASHPTHTYSESGQYTVRLAAANLCGVGQIEQEISLLPTAQTQTEWLKTFKLFPNPATDRCQIRVQAQPSKQLKVVLLTAEGQRVWGQQYRFLGGSLSLEVPLGKCLPGWYIIALEQEGQWAYRSLLKQ